jgi:Spy/CpxP family protein refolding chaperone
MKRIFTGALVLVFMISAAHAQTKENHKGGKHHNKEHKMAFDKLNLSTEQKTHMTALREDFKKQSLALKNNSQLSAEQKQARRKELHQTHKAQVDAILTKEQKDQLAKIRAESKANAKHGKGDRKRDGFKNDSIGMTRKGAGHRDMKAKGAYLQKELNLSSEQQAKVVQLRADFKTKADAVKQDNSLTAEQKRIKMRELMKEQKEQMKTVLTKEQIEKMQTIKKDRPAKITK